eukprot:1158656-Pelagomonas_calceolata.AAC.7
MPCRGGLCLRIHEALRMQDVLLGCLERFVGVHTQPGQYRAQTPEQLREAPAVHDHHLGTAAQALCGVAWGSVRGPRVQGLQLVLRWGWKWFHMGHRRDHAPGRRPRNGAHHRLLHPLVRLHRLKLCVGCCRWKWRGGYEGQVRLHRTGVWVLRIDGQQLLSQGGDAGHVTAVPRNLSA